jgi:hypothetical protein
MQHAPPRVRRNYQDLFLLRPEELQCPSNPVSGPFVTHRMLLLISLQSSREIGFRVVANLVGTFLMLSKTPNPDGSRGRCSLVPVGDFPIGKSAYAMSRVSPLVNPQFPVPRYTTATCRLLKTRLDPSDTCPPLNTRSYGYRTSEFQNSSCSDFYNSENPEKLIPDTRAGVLLHVTPPYRVIGYRRDRDFCCSIFLARGNPEMPNPDSSESLATCPSDQWL